MVKVTSFSSEYLPIPQKVHATLRADGSHIQLGILFRNVYSLVHLLSQIVKSIIPCQVSLLRNIHHIVVPTRYLSQEGLVVIQLFDIKTIVDEAVLISVLSFPVQAV